MGRECPPSLTPAEPITMTTEQESATLARRLEELLRGDNVAAIAELLTSVHPADQADLYQRSDPENRQALLALLSADGLAQLLSHLDEEPLKEAVEGMPRPPLP